MTGALLVTGAPGKADLATDSRQSAQWFSREVGDLLVFQAASTHFLPGDTVGFPGFELGVAGGVSAKKLDVKGYRNLSFTTLNNQGDQISLPTSIAAPAGVVHAKVGLPGGWDLGLKGGSASFDVKEGDSKTEFKNKIFGVEIRKRLLGGGLTGVAVPDLSVSLGFDKASGDITRVDTYSGPVISGGTLTGQSTWTSDWDLSAVTLRAVASKKLLIVTPFAGVGVSKMSGDTDTRAVFQVTGGSAGLSSVDVTGSAKADETVGHAIAGLELSPLPFFRLNLSGLIAKDKWSASLGLRVQFP